MMDSFDIFHSKLAKKGGDFNKEGILYIITTFCDVHMVLFYKIRDYFNTFCYKRETWSRV